MEKRDKEIAMNKMNYGRSSLFSSLSSDYGSRSEYNPLPNHDNTINTTNQSQSVSFDVYDHHHHQDDDKEKVPISVTLNNRAYQYNMRRNNIISMAIIALCVMIGDMTRGITFPTLWFFISSFGGNKEDLGLVVASFSAGRILSSPVFGAMSEKHGYRYVLILSCLITLIGCYVYVKAATVSAIMIGQFILGIGAGTLGVTRSYFAECSTKANRSIYMANLTSVQYMAFTVTPIIGAVLSAYIENKQCRFSFHRFDFFSIEVNSFTLPIIFLSAVTVVCIFLLSVVFMDIRRWHGNDLDRGGSRTLNSLELASTQSEVSPNFIPRGKSWMGMSIETRVAVAGCILNMATKGTIGVFETLGSELGTTQYNWSSVRIGYTFALFGVMGVLSLLSFHFFIRLFGDINLVLFGMTLMIASCMVMIFMQDNVSADYVQFYVALILMYSIGYPLGHTAVLGIVSKITTQGPQGRLLGWFGSAGSLARVIFPLMAGAVSQHYSEKIVFGLMGSILFVSCLSVVIFRNIIQKIIL